MLTPNREVSKYAVRMCERIYRGCGKPTFAAYYLEYLCLHLPEERLEPALEWLLTRGIHGHAFADYVAIECDNSGLELLRQVTKGIERDDRLRKIYAKDLIA